MVRRLSNWRACDNYNEVADDDGGHEERNAGGISDEEAVPHDFDPLAAQHAEDHHERVHEIREIPARHISAREPVHVVYQQQQPRQQQQQQQQLNFNYFFCFIIDFFNYLLLINII